MFEDLHSVQSLPSSEPKRRTPTPETHSHLERYSDLIVLPAHAAMRQRSRRRISVCGCLAISCPCIIVVTVLALVFFGDDDGDGLLQRSFRRAGGPNCQPRRAYACVAHSYSSALGCYTVGKSLILSRTSCPMVVLTTNDVSSRTRSWIDSELGPQVTTRLIDWAGNKRPFDPTLSYLSLWSALTDYDKERSRWCMSFLLSHAVKEMSHFADAMQVVVLGSDTLVLRRMDDLFEREELSATLDVPADLLSMNYFSPSLMVISPSADTHRQLAGKVSNQKNHAFSFRAFINSFFPDWKRLSSSWLTPAWAVAVPDFDARGSWRFVRAIHFTGEMRPWDSQIGDDEAKNRYLQALYRLWWRIYHHQTLDGLDISAAAVFAEPVSWWDRIQTLCGFLVCITAILWALVLYTGCHSGNFSLRRRAFGREAPV